MRYHTWCLAVFSLAGVAGCGGRDTSTQPVVAPNATQTVSDPAGDVLGSSGVQWDLRALTIDRDSTGITATIELTDDALSPNSGAVAATRGFLDLDLDQDPATGVKSTIDEFRNDGGSTGLGVDASVNLSEYAADSTVAVVDAAGREMGRVKPVFDGTRITLHLPRALLGGDDGYVNAAVIVGTLGRPTDFAPNAGHLTLSKPSRAGD